MTHANHTHSPHATPARPRSRRPRGGSRRRRPHASSFSDAVMAAYIHELSVGARPDRSNAA
ncbi:MAG TPA: hypothetical protein VF032_02355 [Thermoleophilaceae bacterium]